MTDRNADKREAVLRDYLEKLGDNWDDYILDKSKKVIGYEEATKEICSLLQPELLSEEEIKELRQCFINESFRRYSKVSPDAPILKKLEQMVAQAQRDK